MTVADTLSSSVEVVSRAGVAEAERLGWLWLVQHTAPVRAKPDGRPHLEEACYKDPTSCSFLLIPPPPYTSRIHYHTPINSLLSLC